MKPFEIHKLEEMFKSVDEMPEDIQRVCIKCMINENESKNMKKEVLPVFLKVVCLLKPENMNAIAKGVLIRENLI